MKIRNVSAVAAAILGAIVAPAALSAQAEVTANAGWASLYYYRGALQAPTSANGGFDVASGPFSAGTWAADVIDGAEIDVYAGVGFMPTEELSLSVGGTGYFYTGEEFDNTYLEINLGAGFGPISVEWSIGQHKLDAPVPVTGEENEKYTFIGITAEQNGLFATVGTSAYALELGDAISDAFDQDLGGQYLEAGYAFSAADIDFVFSGIWADRSLADDGEDYNELSLVFQISKTFTISEGM